MAEESQNNNLDTDAIFDAVAAAQTEELAGSGDAIKEPGKLIMKNLALFCI